MSSKWIWIAVVLIVIIAGAWWWMSTKSATTNQGAAVVTSGSSDSRLGNDSILSAVTKIDTQIATVNTSVAAIGNPPTKAQIATAAGSVAPAVSSINVLVITLRARATNTKTTGGSMPSAQVFNDIAAQLSNASSAAGTAAKNAMATSSNTATLSASATQLKTAAAALQTARADAASILNTLGVK